jgi:hypothetical protein
MLVDLSYMSYILTMLSIRLGKDMEERLEHPDKTVSLAKVESTEDRK